MGRFEGKVALVTGAGSLRGIGRGVALALAGEGARVVITDVSKEGLEKVEAELQEHGPALGLVVDVSQPLEMEQAVARAEDRFGGVDILVNNAGIARATPFFDITPEEYDQVLNVNLRGTFFTCQAVARRIVAQGRGRGVIINLASVAGQTGGGFFGSSHYSASKAGIIGLTKALARELAPQGIRVNCIAPGMIDTDILAGLSSERKAELARATLVGRAGEVWDVARAVLYLASEESSYITGATLDLNGGIYLR